MKKITAITFLILFCLLAICSCGNTVTDYDIDCEDELIGKYIKSRDVYADSSFESTSGSEVRGYVLQKPEGEINNLIFSYLKLDPVYGFCPMPSYSAIEIGKLEKFSLSKSSFEPFILDGTWENGFSAKTVIEGNKYAFEVNENDNTIGYVLIQNDGTLMYARMEAIDTEFGWQCTSIKEYIKTIGPIY